MIRLRDSFPLSVHKGNLLNRQALRIAILLPNLSAGGAERSKVNLARGLAERGFSVDLVLIKAKGEMLEEVPDSVRIVDLGGQRAVTSLTLLVRYLRQQRPHAMLSGLDHVNILAVWARRLSGVTTRLVIVQHTMLSRRVEFAPSLMSRIIPKLAQWCYPWANRIVAVSQGVADDMVTNIGISRQRIRVIYNPISSRMILKNAEQRCDHSWAQEDCPPLIVAAGRLVRLKGFDVLIRAFSEIPEEHEARLIILGEGEERANLEALVRQFKLEDRVSLPGFVSNPYPFMKHAAVFVLSSQVEGLPGVLLEALTCGTPVIATDCPSGPREILRNGELGRLVPVGDYNEMARAITSALSAKENPQGRVALQDFDPRIVFSQYVDLLFPGDGLN